MERYLGKAILKGIAIGPICFFSKEEKQIKRDKVEEVEKEIDRFEAAKQEAISQLNLLYEKAIKEVGEVNAAIFEVHVMMLDDDDFNDAVKNIILTQKVNAEYAVATAGDNFSTMFSEMEDEYFRARAADIKDISERVISLLVGDKSSQFIQDNPVIVVAKDLAPSETVQMDKEKLLGFVTELGSANSHTAILARMMNIPALIGITIQESWNGKLAIIDGYTGTLIVDPDDVTLEEMSDKQKKDQEGKELLQSLKGKESKSLDGVSVKLYANISNVSDIANVFTNDGEGIGLFRSEFLYLEKENYPTEEEQFQAYKSVAEKMSGKKVIIRTMDIGADKKVDYFQLDQEENPAMGYRAIRICLEQLEMFKTQLRAIFRASIFGKISIMFPMIISVDEVIKIKQIIEEIKVELKKKEIPFGEVELGIMIETPAAVMISDLLAKEVDFFSIGTNDLTQYTLAIDRQNPKLDAFYNPHHKAILKMIQMVVENAHKEGCWVGICGELGADLELTKTFLQMGIDELSVAPSFILPMRKKIREMTVKE